MSENLSEKQKIILYRLSILQDEQGRQSSMVPKAKLLGNPSEVCLLSDLSGPICELLPFAHALLLESR